MAFSSQVRVRTGREPRTPRHLYCSRLFRGALRACSCPRPATVTACDLVAPLCSLPCLIMSLMHDKRHAYSLGYSTGYCSVAIHATCITYASLFHAIDQQSSDCDTICRAYSQSFNQDQFQWVLYLSNHFFISPILTGQHEKAE